MVSGQPQQNLDRATLDALRLAILSCADHVHFWREGRSRDGMLVPFKENSKTNPYPIPTKKGQRRRATITKPLINAHLTSENRLHLCNSVEAQIWVLLIELDNKRGMFADAMRVVERINCEELQQQGYFEPSRGLRGAYLYLRFDRGELTPEQAIAFIKAWEKHLRKRFSVVDGVTVDAVKCIPPRPNPDFDPVYADAVPTGHEFWHNEQWIAWNWAKSNASHYNWSQRNYRRRFEHYDDTMEPVRLDQHSSGAAPCGWREGDTTESVRAKVAKFLNWQETAKPLTAADLGIILVDGQPVVARDEAEARRKLDQQRREAEFEFAVRIEAFIEMLEEAKPATQASKQRIKRLINKLVEWPLNGDHESELRTISKLVYRALGRGAGRTAPVGRTAEMMNSSDVLAMTRGCVFFILQQYGDLGQEAVCRLAMDKYKTLPGRDCEDDAERIARFRSTYRWAAAKYVPGRRRYDLHLPSYGEGDFKDMMEVFRSRISVHRLQQIIERLRANDATTNLDELVLLYLACCDVLINSNGGLSTARLRALEADIACWSGTKLGILIEALVEDDFLICTDATYRFISCRTKRPDKVQRRCRQYTFADKAPLPQFALKHLPHEITERQRARYVAPDRASRGATRTDTPRLLLPSQRYWTEIEVHFGDLESDEWELVADSCEIDESDVLIEDFDE